MSTSVQNIIDRAKAFSPLNASLAGDPVELTTRIQQMQQRVFTAIAKLRRPPFTQVSALTSTNAASNRTATLGSNIVEKILRITLPSGVEVFPVSEFDQQAQLAPRYFLRGRTIYEVGSDWGPSGVVTLSMLYAYGAVAIVPTGATSQTISLPDEWADLLIKPLAMYFHTKDPGRDPQEYANLEGEYTQVWNSFMDFVGNYSGDVTRRELLPAPPELAKR